MSLTPFSAKMDTDQNLIDTNMTYELQEFFVVTEIHDGPQSRPNDDYNLAKYKPNPEGPYINIEFQYHQQCIDYMRECDKPNVVFQVQKLYRRVESNNSALSMIANMLK